MTGRRSGGFTLLEVSVAMAILALVLMALFDLNAGALRAHSYVKRLTVATLLARGKMTDIEQQLYDKGFNPDDEDEGGDFTAEGWPQYKWRYKIIAPKLDNVSPEQVIGALFGFPGGLGGDGTSGSGAGGLGGLASLFGGGGSGSTGSGSDPLGGLSSLLGGGGLASLTGAAGGGGGGGLLSSLGPLMGGGFQQMVQQLTQAVREVHLTVSWKEGKQVESIDLVTHVVSLGPGSDRNGTVPGTTPGTAAGNNSYVNSKTGAPVANPQPGPMGTMIDPTDGSPAMLQSQYQAQVAAGGPGPGTLPNPTPGPGAGAFGVPRQTYPFGVNPDHR